MTEPKPDNTLDMSRVSNRVLADALNGIARDDGHMPVTKAVLLEAVKRLSDGTVRSRPSDSYVDASGSYQSWRSGAYKD